MIRVLEDRVVNKIAAGEVVERPASALKELVENALDAGATDLRVELKSGGRQLIVVTDDGHGMDRTDATLCLERHATSKIRTDADLFEVATLGFRGEAVPSIAAVSRFELLTRRTEDAVATRVRIEGGRLIGVEDAASPPGTQVTVRNLFFNVPVRRKFLRTVPTELGHCLEAVTRQSLIRPHLDVEVRHDGRVSIRAPRAEDRAQRAADLLGPHGRALVPAAFERGDLTVQALVSPVGVHKGSAQGATYLYVNGRFVQDPQLRRAVREAYRGIVP
ncbi:MAG: DNA mismatch repair endonuclease MutL, partial [Myxococcota bacterium]|nr:DNA mismatch repair endonuclease MutL [Myxococcota bacterium]